MAYHDRPREALRPVENWPAPTRERMAGALRAYGFYVGVALASSGATAAAVLLAWHA